MASSCLNTAKDRATGRSMVSMPKGQVLVSGLGFGPALAVTTPTERPFVLRRIFLEISGKDRRL